MAADRRAHLQLPFARPLPVGLRRPWEKEREPRKLTSARVRRSFRNMPEKSAAPGHRPNSAPVRLHAWDRTESGPQGAPVIIIRSRRTLRRLLRQPGELGLAEASCPSPVSRATPSSPMCASVALKIWSTSGCITTPTSKAVSTRRSHPSRWENTSATRSTPASQQCCSAFSGRRAGCWYRRCPEVYGRRMEGPSSRRTSPPTCICAPLVRPSSYWRVRALRCVPLSRCVSTTCAPSPPGTTPWKSVGTTSSTSSGNRLLGSGGCSS